MKIGSCQKLTIVAYIAFMFALLVPSAQASDLLDQMQGAQILKFRLEKESQVSIAIYTPTKRLIRVIAQDIQLPAGEHQFRWDGMDMLGNIVPAGTKLQLAVVSGPRVRAKLQFDAINPNPHGMWKGSTKRGQTPMVSGGWMADHSAPDTVVHLPNGRMLIGAHLAEAGHTIMMLTEDGKKVWGYKGLNGWMGPSHLTADDNHAYAAIKNSNIYRISHKGYPVVEHIANTTYGRPNTVAAHKGTLYAVTKDESLIYTAFSESKISIDYENSRPKMPRGKGHTQWHRSPREKLSSIFVNAKRAFDDTGVHMIKSGEHAFVLLMLRKPSIIGTVGLGRIPNINNVDIFYLPAGGKSGFDAKQIANPERSGWRRFGKANFAGYTRPVMYVSAPQKELTIQGILIRVPFNGSAGKGNQSPVMLKMARLLRNRVNIVNSNQEITIPSNASNIKLTSESWSFKSATNVSEHTPANVIIDLKQQTQFRGVMLMNLRNNKAIVEALKPGVRLSSAKDNDWEELGIIDGRANKRMWNYSVITNGNDRFVDPERIVKTQALRIRAVQGMPRGKSMNRGIEADPYRVACSGVYLLKNIDDINPPPPHVLEVFENLGSAVAMKAKRGVKRPGPTKAIHLGVNLQRLVISEDGRFYGILDNQLVELRISGNQIKPQKLTRHQFGELKGIAVRDGKLALSDGEQGLFIFDVSSKRLQNILKQSGWEIGPWDPQRILSGRDVGLDSQGRIWVTEGLYEPRRIAVFNPDGKFQREWFGSVIYGGGGRLDPDLKSFYYRTGHYALDWKAGKGSMQTILDRYKDPNSVTNQKTSYTVPALDRAYHLNGVRYLVGSPSGPVVMVIKPDGAKPYKPTMVMGYAANSYILLKRGNWGEHWSKQKLKGKGFVWCDLNEDGKYDINEVTLFDLPSGVERPLHGFMIAPDLSMRNNKISWKPRGFTAKGTPIFNVEDMVFTKTTIPAKPNWHQSVSYGARAKPHLGGTRVHTSQGNLWLEGHTAIYRPDGSIYGGGSPIEHSGYEPRILGKIMHQPFRTAGQATTKSDVGDVAVLNGNFGRWSIIAPDLGGLLIAEIFTGENGGWGAVENKRDFDVTGYAHGKETFNGDFVRALNGEYYVVAGKTFQTISRVEGLDEKKVTYSSFVVKPESIKPNTALRLVLKQKSNKKFKRPYYKVNPESQLAKSKKKLTLDGNLNEWDSKWFKSVKKKGSFAILQTNKGLVIAYKGISNTQNSGQELNYLWESGFAFDFKWRQSTKHGRKLETGDKRLVFASHRGQFKAVLYDYIDLKKRQGDYVNIVSPVFTTQIAHIKALPQVKVHFKIDKSKAADKLGRRPWSAEVFIPWSVLGSSVKGKKLVADLGIINADTDGEQAGERVQWSHPGPLSVSDHAAETMIEPNYWGSIEIRK